MKLSTLALDLGKHRCQQGNQAVSPPILRCPRAGGRSETVRERLLLRPDSADSHKVKQPHYVAMLMPAPFNSRWAKNISPGVGNMSKRGHHVLRLFQLALITVAQHPVRDPAQA